MEKEFTDDNFEQEAVAASKDKTVLVDFFAAWCGPCKMQGPIIEEIAKEVGDKAVIGKLDIDANPKSAEKYGVMSIPTIVVFKNGEVTETLNGMQSKDVLMKLLD